MITSVDSAISILVVTAIIIKVAVIIRSRKMGNAGPWNSSTL